MSDVPEPPAFPCRSLLPDGRLLRLAGLYPQAQDGLWMQRVQVPAGRLAADEWLALARIARDLTPTAPLHLTTRQGVELHNLTLDRVAAAQQALAAAGLTGLGTGGDTLRNVIVCPGSGLTAETSDLEPLARRVRELLKSVDGIYALPRKFKVSFSACPSRCGRPWIHDVGLLAQRGDGPLTFEVVAGGSLGSRPGTAMRLFDRLPAADVLPCMLALVRLFAVHGDREHRGRARLRHVREQLGDDRFAAMAREGLAAARAERSWPDIDLPKADGRFAGRGVLTFPNGDVTPAQAESLAALAGREDLRVRVGLDHRVFVFGRNAEFVAAALAGLPALERARQPQPAVIACPGHRWCKRGLVDTNGLVARMRALPPGTFPPEATIGISGCPNGCAHSAVADIGLVGGRAAAHGGSREAFTLLTGGDLGRSPRLADVVARGLSADEVLARLSRRAE